MEKEFYNHRFSVSPSICQPFVLSVSKQTVGILRTGLWKGGRAWLDRLTMSGTTRFMACVTYAKLNSREISDTAAIIDRDGSRGACPLELKRGDGCMEWRGSEGG